MLIRVRETKELKKLEFKINGEECAAEIVGSYSFDDFTEEDGVLVCSEEVYNKWNNHFISSQTAEDKLDSFREKNGIQEDVEMKILELTKNADFFNYPKIINEFLDQLLEVSN